MGGGQYGMNMTFNSSTSLLHKANRGRRRDFSGCFFGLSFEGALRIIAFVRDLSRPAAALGIPGGCLTISQLRNGPVV